jgi:hypothetical protein
MDVGDDRHRAFAHDLAQRPGAVLVRGRDADDIGPGLGGALNLFERRGDIVAGDRCWSSSGPRSAHRRRPATLPTMIWRDLRRSILRQGRIGLWVMSFH